jgi:hypothetical protein
MKNSSIKAIQKLLNNNYQTIISFGKRIQKPLTQQRIALLQKQLEIARLMEPKQLWTSKILKPIINELTGETVAYVPKIVQGTYNYSLHGELN